MNAGEKARNWLASDDSMDGYDPVDLLEELLKERDELLSIAENLYNACDNEGLREAKEFLESLGANLI